MTMNKNKRIVKERIHFIVFKEDLNQLPDLVYDFIEDADDEEIDLYIEKKGYLVCFVLSENLMDKDFVKLGQMSREIAVNEQALNIH